MSDIFDDEGDAFNQIQSLKAENKQLKADIKQTKGLVLNAYRKELVAEALDARAKEYERSHE